MDITQHLYRNFTKSVVEIIVNLDGLILGIILI
jgi:hypothetical protein